MSLSGALSGPISRSLSARLVPRDASGLPTPPVKTLIFGGGQSLMEYHNRGNPRSSVVLCQEVRSLFEYTPPRAFSTYLSGSVTHDGLNQNGTDWTVKFVNKAVGGTELVDVFTPSYIATGQYWWNTQDNTATTGNPLDVADSPGPLARLLLAEVEVAGQDTTAFFWSQGTQSAGQLQWPTDANGNNAKYDSSLRALFTAVRTACGKPNLPVFIQRIGRHQTSANPGYAALSEIQTAIAATMPNVKIGSEEYDGRMAVTRSKSVTLTLGSNVVLCSDTSNVLVNDAIEGPGIPANASVNSVSTNVSFNLQTGQNATADGAATVFCIDRTHLYPGAEPSGSIGQPYDTNGNTQHNQTDGSYAVSKRMARALAAHFGKPLYWQGPKITGAVLTGAVLDVSIEHDGGDDITAPNVPGVWRVSPPGNIGGTPLTVSSVSRLNATTIRLQLSGTPAAGSMVLWYVFGSQNKRQPTDYVRDNASPLLMPLQRVDKLPITRA